MNCYLWKAKSSSVTCRGSVALQCKLKQGNDTWIFWAIAKANAQLFPTPPLLLEVLLNLCHVKNREYAWKNLSPWTGPFYTWSSKDWCNVVFSVVLAVVLRDICSLIHCPNIGSLGLFSPILASPPSWPCKMVMSGIDPVLESAPEPASQFSSLLGAFKNTYIATSFEVVGLMAFPSE